MRLKAYPMPARSVPLFLDNGPAIPFKMRLQWRRVELYFHHLISGHAVDIKLGCRKLALGRFFPANDLQPSGIAAMAPR